MNAALNFFLVIFFAWSQQCFAARQARLPPPTPQEQPPGPLGPQTLSPNQCSVGATRTGIANITDRAEDGVLYVDIGRPAQCSGEIVRWEVCYGTVSETHGEPNVTILVIRENNAQNYRISAQYQLVLDDASELLATCQYIEAVHPILVEAGDVIGFYSTNVRIVFATHDTPVLSRYTPLLQGSNGVLGIDTLQQNQLEPLNEDVAPVLRLIMNSTDENSTVTPSPSPTSRTPCPTKKGKGGFVSATVFTSVVVVAVVIIFVLFVMMCLLVCCLCGAPCMKCCKLSSCFSRRQAEPTKKAASQVAQPITDQSMQYNDMYVPRDPTQIITGGKKFKTHIFGNPAYDTPTSRLKKDRETISPAGYDIPVSKVQRRDQDKSIASFKTNLADLTCSEIDGELDHTYETISG